MRQTTIKINKQELILKQSFRALMLFEELTGKNAYQINTKVGDSIHMFYSMLSAANPSFNMSFDDFLATLDDKPDLLTQFNTFMLSLLKPEKLEKAVKDKKKVETRTNH